MKTLASLFILPAFLAIPALSAVAGSIQGAGLVVLNSSADGALSMTGSTTVRIPASTVYVNSSSRTAVKTVGNATLDTPSLYLCGGTSFSGNSGCTGTVTRTLTPYLDPCSATPVPSYSDAPNRGTISMPSSGELSLQPGYYPSGLSVTGSTRVSLAAGTYFMGGTGFKVASGSVSGTGVTIVMVDGSVDIAGGSTIRLSAPTTGALANLVFFQPSTRNADMKFAGGSSTVITGTIYSPRGIIWLTGNSTASTDGPQMGDMVVADQVRLTGTGAIKIGSPSMPPVNLPSLACFD